MSGLADLSREALLAHALEQEARLAEQQGRLTEQQGRLTEQQAELTELTSAHEELKGRYDELAVKVARLEHLLSRNSGNSSMPPSQDDQPGNRRGRST